MLDNTLNRIVIALESIASSLESLQSHQPAAAQTDKPKKIAKPVEEYKLSEPVTVAVETPTVTPAAVVEAAQVATNGMPALPAFMNADAATHAVTAHPFTNANDVSNYVVAAYGSIGAPRNAQLQSIIENVGGAKAISLVDPSRYGALHEAVEQLKVA